MKRSRIYASALRDLSLLHQQGKTDNLKDALQHLPAAEGSRLKKALKVQSPTLPMLTETTTPQWLAEGVQQVLDGRGKGKRKRKFSAPTWIEYVELPPLIFENQVFTLEQGTAVLMALRYSTLEEPHAFVPLLRQHLPPYVREQFAHALAKHWYKHGMDLKEKWAFLAIALLGGEGSVAPLVSKIRSWISRSGDYRFHVAVGLECLQYIATESSLYAVLQLIKVLKTCNQVSFQKLAEETEQVLITQHKHKFQDLLELCFPKCGINDQGIRLFDYGTATYTLTVQDDLRFSIRGADHKVYPTLPKPRKQMNSMSAQQTYADWGIFQQELSILTRELTQYWKQCMISQRRWTLDQWRLFVMEHPLLQRAAKNIVWGVFLSTSPQSSRITGLDQWLKNLTSQPLIQRLFGIVNSFPTTTNSFRITAEGDLADYTDQSIQLPLDARIGIVHPLHLSQTERERWLAIFHDYELISSFNQLTRTTYTLTPTEQQTTALTRFAQHPVDFGIHEHFRALGYNRQFYTTWQNSKETITKKFQEDEITAKITFQHLRSTKIIIEKCEWVASNKNVQLLGAVDPIIISETIHDIHTAIALSQ